MTGSLARYHSRAPRYILHPQDNTLIRVAGPHQTPWEEGTEIKNLSVTGLAFTAPTELCPQIGEVIKIQFQVTMNQPMACHALVTRLETQPDRSILVGVQFYKMDPAQKLELLHGLAKNMKLQQLRSWNDQKSEMWASLKQHWPRTLLMLLALSGWAALFLLDLRS